MKKTDIECFSPSSSEKNVIPPLRKISSDGGVEKKGSNLTYNGPIDTPTYITPDIF